MTDVKTPYATRLCLSGLESRRLLETFADFGVKHIQVSYYYLRKVFSEPKDFELFVQPFSTVLIDSGTVYHKFKSKQEEGSFLGEYASYIGALDKHSYTAAVYEEGANIEETVPEEMLIYPLDIVRPVFDNDLKALFRNVKYVGVSNKEASYKGGENMAPIVSAAREQGAYIHVFGTSSKRILSKYPLYSANTSSWRSGSRYLNTYIYEGPSRGLRLYQPSDKSDAKKTERELKVLRTRQENIIKVKQDPLYKKIVWGDVYEGDPWEVDKANLTQWLLYQQDLELSPHKAYWLDDNMKGAILERKKELLGNMSPPTQSREREESDQTPQETRRGREAEDTRRAHQENAGAATEENPEDKGEEGGIDVTEEVEGVPVLEDPESQEGSSTASTPTQNSEELEKNAIDALIPRADIGGDMRLTPIDERMRQVRQCDFCILAGRCPKYEPGAACAFGLPPENPTYDHTQLERHVMEDAADLLAIQKDRIQQAYLEEKMDAAGLSKDLGKEMQRYMELVALLSEATDKRDTLSIQAKGRGIMEMFKKR